MISYLPLVIRYLHMHVGISSHTNSHQAYDRSQRPNSSQACHPSYVGVLRQEDCKCKVTLGHRLSSWPAWATVTRSCHVKGTSNSSHTFTYRKREILYYTVGFLQSIVTTPDPHCWRQLKNSHIPGDRSHPQRASTSRVSLPFLAIL